MIVFLFDYLPVYCETCIRTHCGTRGTAYARLRVSGVGIVISSVIYFFGLQCQNICRARHHAQITALAASCVYYYGTYNFCHDKTGELEG